MAVCGPGAGSDASKALPQIIGSASRQQGCSQEERQCWICFSSDGRKLIAPCACSGSLKWVHGECLTRWRFSSTNPQSLTHCRHCGFKYRVVSWCTPLQSHENELRRQQRRHVLAAAAGQSVLWLAALQTHLVVLSTLLWLADPKESLVELYGSHRGPEKTFREELCLDRRSYFFAAVLLSLFVLGLVVSNRTGMFAALHPAIFKSGDVCCVLFGMIFCIVVVVLLVVLGAGSLLAGLFSWWRNVTLQLRELRPLTGDLVVQDLSEMLGTASTPPPPPLPLQAVQQQQWEAAS